MTCWHFHILFMICSWIVHKLFKSFSLHVHDLFMTILWHITCPWLVHDYSVTHHLSKTCSWLVTSSQLVWSLVIYSFFFSHVPPKTCWQLAYNLFITCSLFAENLTCSILVAKVHLNQFTLTISIQTKPSSDSEAATVYKLKGQSSNMQTGQGFKYREMVRPAGLTSRPV